MVVVEKKTTGFPKWTTCRDLGWFNGSVLTLISLLWVQRFQHTPKDKLKTWPKFNYERKPTCINIKGKRSWKERGPAMTVIPIIWQTNNDMNGNISFFGWIMEILVLTKTRALLDKEKRHHMLDINVR